MQKKSYKDIIKKYSKGVIYVAVLMTMTAGSVVSILSMRKNIVSSINKDTQKIFSSTCETLENVVMTNKEETCIETKKEDRKSEKQPIVESDKNEENSKEEGKISYIKYDEKDLIDNKKETDAKVEAKKENKEISNEQNISSTVLKEQNKEEYKDVFLEDKKTFIKPLSGEIANDFSDEKLTYSKTLDEWRVHQGIDVLAKEGTNVKAVFDGYVEEIKNDDEYGTTVVIRHTKSLVSVYKNLANEILVLPNQIIKQGDVIGLVGNTAKIESEISPHLHFEMIKNKKLVDPNNYIQFN